MKLTARWFLAALMFGAVVGVTGFGLLTQWSTHDHDSQTRTVGSVKPDLETDSSTQTNAQTSASNQLQQIPETPALKKAPQAPPVPVRTVSDASSVDSVAPTPGLDKENWNKLLTTIAEVSTIPPDSIDELARGEAALLELLDSSDSISKALLDLYSQPQSAKQKELVAALLATSASQSIETEALARLNSAQSPESRSDWLRLLANRGVSSADGRNAILSTLPNLEHGHDIRNAMASLTQDSVPLEERRQILMSLEEKVYDHRDIVRGGAIEAIGRWGNNEHAAIIESALFDESEQVRSVALMTAFSSKIRDPQLKSSLLRILNNEDEQWQFRMQAYTALDSYQLDDEEYEELYRFSEQLKSSQKGPTRG